MGEEIKEETLLPFSLFYQETEGNGGNFFSIFSCIFSLKCQKYEISKGANKTILGVKKLHMSNLFSPPSSMGRERERAIVAEQSQPHLVVAQAQSLFLMGVELSA